MSPRTSGQEDLPNSLLAYLNILVWILGTESLITIREHRVVPHPGQAHSWGHQDKIGVSWCEGAPVNGILDKAEKAFQPQASLGYIVRTCVGESGC